MAKMLLWFFVIFGFVATIISYSNGDDVGMFVRILIFSILGVLAICESIEKIKS